MTRPGGPVFEPEDGREGATQTATDSASPHAAAPGKTEADGRVVGRYVVLGMLLLTVLAALAVLHDASSTNAVMSVPASATMARPRTASLARRATLAFVPAGAQLSIAGAIAAATGFPATRLQALVRVRPLGGGGWVSTLSVPVDERALLRAGRIFTGVGQGTSNLSTGLLQVTSGQVQFVVRVTRASHDAVFAFRLSASGQTLSATDWNANTVLSQTEVGDQGVP